MVVGAVALLAAGFIACTSASTSGGASTASPSKPDSGNGYVPPVPDPPDDGGSGITIDPTGVPDASTDCQATAKPGSIYAINVTTLTSEKSVPMCIYQGKVLLVVNTASMCGYTPQYGPLQTIYQQYASQGFLVLGFPSQTFNQEYADAGAVSSFCTSTYGITFPMFSIANVNPPDEQPLYTWLKAQPNGLQTDIEWNFAKFIIGKTGDVVKRFDHTITPDDPMVTSVIQAELAK
jgi:glutathione peroxidase